MTCKVLFEPSAVRELGKLARDVQVRIMARIEALAKEPRPAGVKKLEGMKELYRVRAGDYRVVYQIQDERLVVLVVRIAHRREVYR
jgi:mRNA interferase RelE/StbE